MFIPPNLLHIAKRAFQAIGGQQSGIHTGPATILADCIASGYWRRRRRKEMVILRLVADV